MYGVVLWSDPAAGKAVVWCEDQGDLAFYCSAEMAETVSMDVGDWVQFDLQEDRGQRLVCNPRRMGTGRGYDIQDMVVAAALRVAKGEETRPEPAAAKPAAQVIPFAPAGASAGDLREREPEAGLRQA